MIVIEPPIPTVADLPAIRDFATRRHAFDRWLGGPFEVHLERVEAMLVKHGYDRPTLRAAAWLHDAIEDTDTTRGEIERLAGFEVADLVWAVTGVGPNRKARNADIARKLAVYPRAWSLKLADRVVNLEGMVEHRHRYFASMYLLERTSFCDGIPLRDRGTDLYFHLLRAYEACERFVVETS